MEIYVSRLKEKFDDEKFSGFYMDTYIEERLVKLPRDKIQATSLENIVDFIKELEGEKQIYMRPKYPNKIITLNEDSSYIYYFRPLNDKEGEQLYNLLTRTEPTVIQKIKSAYDGLIKTVESYLAKRKERKENLVTEEKEDLTKEKQEDVKEKKAVKIKRPKVKKIKA